LGELADDHCAGGVGKIRQLSKMIVGDAPRSGALEWSSNEQRPFYGRRDDNRIAAYLRILVR